MSDNLSAKLMTIGEIIQEYRIGRTTIYKHLKSGSLKAMKVGRSTRVWRTDVENWLKAQPEYSAKG